MKNLLTALTLLGSASAFAAPVVSEFERGYEAGKLTCENELWSCHISCKKDGLVVYQEGYSRARALKNLLDTLYNRKDCQDDIRVGEAICRML